MNISSEVWFRWAVKLMPQDRANWLSAMKVELEQISDPSTQTVFAFGCFKTAVIECARSRKGLSYIARGGVASLMLMCSSGVGIFWATKINSQPDTMAIAKIITVLCLVYMCGAALLVASLKGLKVYAVTGFTIASLSWVYCLFTPPKNEVLSPEFLAAISLEAAGLMAGLFVFAVYLSLLYNPEIHDA